MTVRVTPESGERDDSFRPIAGDAVLSRAIGASPLAARLAQRCLFHPSTDVACAVSGGPDSVALAVLAVRFGFPTVVIHHVDHGLRPDSGAEAIAVEELATRLGAAFVSHSVGVGTGPNLEERARTARYRTLPATVATGHTADDLAETVVLNLLRGSGLDGVASMARRRLGAVQRPLLRLRRTETVELCEELGLPTLDDPMNHDPSFRRVRVRRELFPLMDRIAERDTVAILARHGEVVADEVALLDELSSGVDPGARWGLVDVARPLARRALRRWLVDGGVGGGRTVDEMTLDRVLDVALGETTSCDAVGGWRVTRTDGTIRLVAPPSASPVLG